MRSPLPMTVRDFIAWDPGNHQRYELVDGLPRAMTPTALTHGVLQNELGSLLGNHLREHRPGCHVAANPGVTPRVLSAQNVRIPDMGVTCTPITSGEALMREPVLLVEILSPSNYSETWSNVWTYCSITVAAGGPWSSTAPGCALKCCAGWERTVVSRTGADDPE